MEGDDISAFVRETRGWWKEEHTEYLFNIQKLKLEAPRLGLQLSGKVFTQLMCLSPWLQTPGKHTHTYMHAHAEEAPQSSH